MTNPHEHEVENYRVEIRCPECRTHFHERLHRVVSGAPVKCPTCHEELRFTDVGHIHDHDTVSDYIHHVEERTRHPHY